MRISPCSWKTIVAIVPVLIGIARDSRIHWPSTACADDAGIFPSFGEIADPAVSAIQGAGLVDPGKNESAAVVGHAIRPLGVGRVGILNRCRTSGHKCILAIIHCMRVGVAEPEIKTVRHLAPNRKSCAVIHALSSAFEYLNCPELGNRKSDIERSWAAEDLRPVRVSNPGHAQGNRTIPRPRGWRVLAPGSDSPDGLQANENYVKTQKYCPAQIASGLLVSSMSLPAAHR